MTDVALVCMPFSHLELPIMATGLLKAHLVRRGFTCDAKYFHLNFASHIGYDEYELIDKHCTDDWNIGEWLFSHHVFDDKAATLDQYLAIISTYVSNLSAFREHLLFWRTQVDSFLNDLLSKIDWSSYNIVGFSLVHQQTMASLALARRIKQRYPNIYLVMGGGSCQGKMGQAMYRAFDWIDYLCTGEGDYSFPSLVECLIKGVVIPELPGILRRVNGTIVLPEESTRAVTNMDELPTPDFLDYLHQLEENNLQQFVKPGILAEGARGCWWGEKSPCTFCGLNGPTIAFRSKSNEHLLRELTSMLDQYSAYSIKRVQFVENILSIKHLREVIPVLQNRIQEIELFYELKVNLKRQDIAALRNANILRVQPGVESLQDNILRLMAKGATLLQNIQTIKWFMEYGIDPVYNLLYGFPGEIPENYTEMIETIRQIKHLPSPRAIRKIRLERFSLYFDAPETYGIKNIRSALIYREIFPLPEPVLFNFVHNFDFDYVGPHPDTYIGEWKAEAANWIQHNGEAHFVAANWENKIICLDTRFKSKKAIIILEGIEAKIFDLCDTIQSPDKIVTTLNVSKEYVESILNKLVEAKYLLRVGQRYLCIAVRVDQYIPADLPHFDHFIALIRLVADRLSMPLLKLRDEMTSTADYKKIWAN